jgi:hypothetical protein
LQQHSIPVALQEPLEVVQKAATVEEQSAKPPKWLLKDSFVRKSALRRQDPKTTPQEIQARKEGKVSFSTEASELTEPAAPIELEALEPKFQKKVIRVLYIFSGIKRKSDVAGFLKKLLDPKVYEVLCWNVDLKVNKKFDVTDESFVKKLTFKSTA